MNIRKVIAMAAATVVGVSLAVPAQAADVGADDPFQRSVSGVESSELKASATDKRVQPSRKQIASQPDPAALGGEESVKASTRLNAGLRDAKTADQQPGQIADSPTIAASPGKSTPGALFGVIDEVNYMREGLTAAQRVISAHVTQTQAGSVKVVYRLAAAPSAASPVRIDLLLGRWNDNGSCIANFELRAIPHDSARAGFGSDSTWKNTYAAKLTRSGATVTAETPKASAIKNAKWDCAWLYTGVEDSGGQLTIGQSFYAVDLSRSELSIRGIDNPIRAIAQGKWLDIRLDVHNSGDAPATGTKVTLKGKKLKLKPKNRNVGTVDRRSTSYGVKFRVKLNGKKKQKLTITASAANGAKATRTMTIHRLPKATKYKSLAGKYFWGFATTSLTDYSGWDTNTVYFANKRFVHVGFPKGGKLPKCTKKSKTCKRYKYNAKKGQVKIGKKRFKINSRGFSANVPGDGKKRFYSPLTLPKKGAKFKVDLTNKDWSGYCLLSCTATTQMLAFKKNGSFIKGSYSIGSWPGLGSSWAVIPPDKRGTYKMIGKGRIELRYADGTKKRMVVGVQQDEREKPSARYEGVVLGDTNFYNED